MMMSDIMLKLEMELNSLRDYNERINVYVGEVDQVKEEAIISMTIDGMKGELIKTYSFKSIIEHGMQKQLLAIAQFNIAKDNEVLRGV